MSLALVLLGSYLLGSIPTSFLVGRLLGGIDLREHGSRNLGATNVYRVMGPWYAIPVGLFDVAKGTIAVLALAPLAGRQPWLPLLAGATAVLGHVFTVFLRFRGGKGVATAAGVLAAVAPLPVAVCAVLWLVAVFATGYVSLGSIVAAVAFPVATWILVRDDPYTLAAGVVLGGLILYTHRANVRRLLQGTESRFGPRRKREA
ncbi:MAG: glycerol-3-phosphate 1-O-acyltransferase PlsY [Gemmatimonadetes bacterium]|nr:glycerol-3-phosphate 1-O-acyltransferase PlsY [Gemmatimonadota bacterium]